mmetsp:Transcript_11544/g.43118  ORF Transcript_11544/g.43118 Transcript_11544/m.43118 type:complete len:126 (+) Transcript_11544:4051-4428(+)
MAVWEAARANSAVYAVGELARPIATRAAVLAQIDAECALRMRPGEFYESLLSRSYGVGGRTDVLSDDDAFGAENAEEFEPEDPVDLEDDAQQASNQDAEQALLDEAEVVDNVEEVFAAEDRPRTR